MRSRAKFFEHLEEEHEAFTTLWREQGLHRKLGVILLVHNDYQCQVVPVSGWGIKRDVRHDSDRTWSACDKVMNDKDAFISSGNIGCYR